MLHSLVFRLNERRDRAVARAAGLLGLHPDVIPFGGIGSEAEVRLRGRVVMAGDAVTADELRDRHGFRHLADAQVPRQPVVVTFGAASRQLEADEDGYIDVVLPGHGMSAGWHDAAFQVLNAEDVAAGVRPIRATRPVHVPVRIVGADETAGVVTDIDDTVIESRVPHLLTAAYLMLVEQVRDRVAVRGMAQFITLLTRRDSGRQAPVMYLTSNLWNNLRPMRDFLENGRFPRGAFSMTDFGITPTGWFRSGQAHKTAELRALHAMLPQVSWYLVGDDGEHDPDIYADFAREFPGAVRGIAVRSVDGGRPRPLDDLPAGIPVWIGEDGNALLRQIAEDSTNSG